MLSRSLRASALPGVHGRCVAENTSSVSPRLAVDLHLHSRYASGVSPAMTLVNIALAARRKGLDVLATGDCLQPDWCREIEATLVENNSGLLTLRPEIEEQLTRAHPSWPYRPLRFVVSTEVCCAPPGTPELGGIHHLIYFRSIESARCFQTRVATFGDLREGRPSLALSSQALLALVLEHGDGSELVPAHVLNPWYATLGSKSGAHSPQAFFGDLTPHLLALEMGLPATPVMCRQISAIDQHALLSCSDAHSLEKIGREYTVLEVLPTYAALMRALRFPEAKNRVSFVKLPVERTRYYRNHCGVCRESFDDTACPRCRRALAIGSRDRLATIADRHEPDPTSATTAFTQLLPLASLIAELVGTEVSAVAVRSHYQHLLQTIGDERYILNEASEAEIAQVHTRQLAHAIVAQRTSPRQTVQRGAPVSGNIDQLVFNL